MDAAEARDALTGPPDVVARRLLGAVLRHGAVTVRLTEVEAYGGSEDPGSHAYRGRTSRNATMFGPPGLLYCYFTYGMHTCVNVVCGTDGEAAAVLLRAGEIIDGWPVARVHRPGVADRDLARGPANLCRALGITLDDDGAVLGAGAWTLELAPVSTVVADAGPRTGLRLAPDVRWRFWTPGAPSVSVYRRHPKAGPRPAGDDDARPDLHA